jgi:hypothetical protein
MSWVHRAHDALSLAWLARRRAARQHSTRVVQARVARFFMWCRTSRGGGEGVPPGGLGVAGDNSGLDDEIPEASEEPSEVKDVLNELSQDDAVNDNGKPTLVISIGSSGFGKSVELVALGMVSVVCGAADQAAGAVDNAVVALWGMRSLLGLRPKFSVQACTFGEATQAARAWNDESAPAVRNAMHGRWDMLQREVRCPIYTLSENRCSSVCPSEGAETDALPGRGMVLHIYFFGAYVARNGLCPTVYHVCPMHRCPGSLTVCMLTVHTP